MKSFPIVILGGGVVAGYAAKEFVAQSGKKGGLAIVTAENALPYERPPLSKGFLAGKEEASDIQISDAAFYREHGIAVYRNFPVGKVDFRRRRLQSTSGKVIGFDQLLIATGSTVRRLKVPGANRSEVFYLRQMKDSQAIQAQIKRGKRAVVIGSGFIGMEVASVLASHGVRTTMVFPDDRVWKRLFTPPVSTFFERQFAGHGITFMKSDKVVALTHKNHEVPGGVGIGKASAHRFRGGGNWSDPDRGTVSTDSAGHGATASRSMNSLRPVCRAYGLLVISPTTPIKFSIAACEWSTGTTPWSRGGWRCAT